MPNFEWIPFYRTFAEGLIPYCYRQPDLVAGIRQAFDSIGIKQPTLDEDGTLQHMDPFTVFGLFNKSGMKDSKRILVIEGLTKALDIKAEAPKSFDGIPVLSPLNSNFYPFSNKNDDAFFNKLWSLFITALKYADNPKPETKEELKELIDFAITTKYNGNSKVTMGLYWIAPDTFINLDSRNEWYIYESGKMPAEFVSTLPKMKGIHLTGEKYFDILEKVKAYLPQTSFNSFTDLSYEAWRYSEEVNVREAELKKAEKKVNEDVENGLADEDVQGKRYWIFSPGEKASKWEEFSQEGTMRIGWGQLGDLMQYPSREAMRDKMKEFHGEQFTYTMDSLATWQFSRVLKPGDVVFAKKGTKKLVGRGVVTGEYEFDPEGDSEYAHVHKINWTDKGLWVHPGSAITKTLTDITPYTEYVADLQSIFDADKDDDEEDPTEVEMEYPPYTKESFLSEVFMDDKEFETLAALLKKKKNVILQGAPGVGKTYTAKRLAYALMGEKNQDRVMMIQFHQSYSYEDFIEGFRPDSNGDGFIIKKGSFYQFCKKATDDLDHDYYFIIDEINRGNMSRIFGELFMLVEADKRGNALQLLYSDEKFSVPKNVYLIGTMNTADRSLALLDYALRRRFAFFDMKPGFDSAGFRVYRESKNNPKFNKLITQVKMLNDMITADDTLGEGFCIGHSYFSNLSDVSDQTLGEIIEFELAPLLKEYWYDEKSKAEDAIFALKEAIK